jgi:hypothetical protein
LVFKKFGKKETTSFIVIPMGEPLSPPYHSGRNLARPSIREILRGIELTPEQFRKLLEEL